jgi:phosphoenolpyruvate synthase/pyruvate phosphate dikinase
MKVTQGFLMPSVDQVTSVDSVVDPMTSLMESRESDLSDLKREVDKIERDFCVKTGCSSNMMTAIDNIYAERRKKHDEECKALDVHFGEFRRKRDEYIVQQTETLSVCNRNADHLRGVLKNIENMNIPDLTSDALKSIRASIRQSETKADSIKACFLSIFGQEIDEKSPAPIPVQSDVLCYSSTPSNF